ncbi:hypothetical protein BKA59DRAFT_503334 [Fusarium tricinctum]|uniref:Uncharacterized protein n=1 Tax=Fusarium tricinctum TaxID=61284 RepID=A0A8K0RQM8_9HYPO|nr:hypothetical protein BKA59DRAFT_503334 [Fusarium tricinctum]
MDHDAIHTLQYKKAVYTNWLRRIGWETIFRKAPVYNKRRLLFMTVRVTDIYLRRWLRGRYSDRPYKMPFKLVIRPSSEKSAEYVNVDPAANKDGGHDGDEGKYKDEDDDKDDDKDDQKRAVMDTSNPSNDKVTSTWSSNSQEDHPQDPTVDILLRFYYSTVTKDYDSGVASLTMLVYFSAVRGLMTPEGDKYLKPYRFTPTLAKLIYYSQLIFLKAVLPRFLHIYRGFAYPPRHGLLRRLNAACREYIYDSTLSPMGEFLSLLLYSNALYRS